MSAFAYTPDTYNAITITLEGDYTPDNYQSISIILDKTASTDTCTCAGLNTDWAVALSDYCVITTACDLGTGKLSFTGSGNFTCDATINTTDLGDPGADGIVWIRDDCIIGVA